MSFNQLLVDQAQVSLTFAAFPTSSSGGERLGAGPAQRLGATSFPACPGSGRSTLYRADAEHQPESVHPLICSDPRPTYPRIGITALRAEAFIVTPAWLQRL